MDAVVVTSNLSKSYGSHEALKQVNLEVYKGEVFGYLGPMDPVRALRSARC